MSMNVETETRRRSRGEIAARIAADIRDGWYVNLGVGMPTLVANYIPGEREVVIHSENGVLGMGPAQDPPGSEPWLVNAGKQYVTLLKGGAYVHHADSFAMIRGGHLDLCVLGAFQVAANGDIANWATSENDTAPAVGGAMDLSVGAKNLWVAMNHTTREGEPKIVNTCTYPLTAERAVKRIYTDLAVISVTPDGLEVEDMVEGLTFAELQAATEAPLGPGQAMRRGAA
jgi:3-oxoadipate CoA-transferase beta subunit